jgi:hypothetical protein
MQISIIFFSALCMMQVIGQFDRLVMAFNRRWVLVPTLKQQTVSVVFRHYNGQAIFSE